ncbi:MAG: hypothetical protein ACRDP9_03610 [Kribbellaceae bacterium]
MVQLRLAYGEHELTFLSTVATFGTPLDITVSELVIESFFPRGRADRRRAARRDRVEDVRRTHPTW